MSKAATKQGLCSVLCKLYQEYTDNTPQKIRLTDAYMFCIVLTGVFQFVYCCVVGTFPFNAFLSGFISTVASFVLAASYRIQINKQNQDIFNNISSERSFADFIFAHVILHLVVVNFIG